MDISKLNGQREVAVSVSQGTKEVQKAPKQEQVQQDELQKESSKQVSAKDLESIAKKLNEQMEDLGTNLRFGYSDKINAMYLSVTEKSTGKEIRKIPSEEAMRLAEHFKDVIGLIFDKKS